MSAGTQNRPEQRSALVYRHLPKGQPRRHIGGEEAGWHGDVPDGAEKLYTIKQSLNALRVEVTAHFHMACVGMDFLQGVGEIDLCLGGDDALGQTEILVFDGSPYGVQPPTGQAGGGQRVGIKIS